MSRFGSLVSTPAPSIGGNAPLESATERAYRRIEEAIVTMEILPGAIVHEAFLSELCNLGRGPVRDAVRRLSVEHLLVVKPKRGICITEIAPFSQMRLLEVRQEIERLAFCSAARRATDEQRALFAALSEDFRHSAQTADELLFIRTDKVFNDLSRKSARNEFAADSLLLIQGLSRRFWFRYFGQFEMLYTSAMQHADVAAAIAAGNVEEVSLASDRLSLSAQDFARRVSESNY
jgi:DNA-binding GntR family transcriptional regulator